MSQLNNKKEIIIKTYNITQDIERAEKEANELISQGYELFSSNMGSMYTNWLSQLVLIYKKKK